MFYPSSFISLEQQLLHWCNKKRNSIFTIDGPSQIGKTHCIHHFVAHNPKKHIFIDVKKNKNILEKMLNSSHNTAEDFCAAICFELRRPAIQELTLLIFDGVEYCPLLRQFFKTLVQYEKVNIVAITCGGNGPSHYKNLLIPSEEEVHHLFPLSFYDFLIAIEQNTLAEYIFKAIIERRPISEYLSSELYRLFKIYNLVGGYPLTISQYIEKNDLNSIIETNKSIVREQFKHAMSLLNDDDCRIVDEIENNYLDFIKGNKYNSIDGVSSYKTKQILSFLEEEYIFNISCALDIRNLDNLSNGKKILASHQCFINSMNHNLDRTTYFDGNEIREEVVLTDFYFNQRRLNKELKYALLRGTRYFESDALVLNNSNAYLITVRNKRTYIDYNLRLSNEAENKIEPGVILLNDNVFEYGQVIILPSYCSCFLYLLLDRDN